MYKYNKETVESLVFGKHYPEEDIDPSVRHYFDGQGKFMGAEIVPEVDTSCCVIENAKDK